MSQPSDVATRAPVEYGDLLLVSAGSSIGKSCLYLSHDPACYAGFLTRVRPESVHTGLFLSYWTQSAHFVDQVRSTAVQATIENFSASRYKDLRVPVVPNDQQKRIVRFLDAETAKIDHLIAKQRKLLKLLDLRNEARWQEAFTGFTPLKKTSAEAFTCQAISTGG
ncbi:restriction endonuclease subunit S [Corynebacterium diphtheriae bv. mitis]|nr:restriction endonuclease subunit S [Corynebacterium diphtheriae bv. mitis]